MPTIRGCAVSTSLLRQWAALLVTENAPFFISDALYEQLSADHHIWTRAEFATLGFSLSFVDSYRTYAVSPTAPWVVQLSPSAFDALSPATQTALINEQSHFGRGQVYAWREVQSFVATLRNPAAVASRQSTTANATVLLLDTSIWAQLAPAVREQWLVQFVTQQEPTYPTIRADVVPWAHFAERDLGWIRTVGNTFTATSGPNCLATTLAAISPRKAAATLGTTWLWQAPFLHGLADCGYTKRIDGAPWNELRDAVLVWRDHQQVVQHACYVLGAGVALNKNGQAWYDARELAAVDDVLAEWADESFTVAAYVRES